MNYKKVEVLEIEHGFGGDYSVTCIILRDEQFLGSSITTKDDPSLLERGMWLTMLFNPKGSRPLALYSKDHNIWIETNYNSEKEILPTITYLLMLIPFGTLLLIENLVDILSKRNQKRDFLQSTNPHWVYCCLFLSFCALIGSLLLTYNIVINDEIDWNQYIAISLIGVASLFIHIKVFKKTVDSLIREAKIKLKIH